MSRTRQARAQPTPPLSPSASERGEYKVDRIFLIGYRGSGKTTVARLLAQALAWDWADADEYLEKKHDRTIREIFAEEGESGFRDKEQEVVAELCLRPRTVIATGGGVVLRPENRAHLRGGFVVWLHAAAPVLFARMLQDVMTAQRRPSLITGGLAEVEELLKVREPMYKACADLTIDTTTLSPEQVTAHILDKFRAVRS